MSETPHPDSLSYYVAVPIADEDDRHRLDEFLAKTDWTIDVAASRWAPAETKVVRLEVEPGDQDRGETPFPVYEELSSHGLLEGDLAMMLLPSVGPGDLSRFLPPAPSGNSGAEPAKEPQASDVPASPPAPPKGGDGAGGGNGTVATAAASTPAPAPSPAATVAAAASVFPDPSKLWAYLAAPERSRFAEKEIKKLNEERSAFARRSEWSFAPELILLDVLPADEQPSVARALLEVKGGLTPADAALRTARTQLEEKKVELLGQDIEMAKKRVALAGQGVAIAGEIKAHMERWRSLADAALIALVITTIFSMLTIGYILLHLAPAGKISDAAIPVIIFVLALFAISPAVLLLRERPLEGLDKWSPGGGVEEGEEKTPPGADGGSDETKDPQV
ncbi:MAG TPA: hypothetical protein VNC16_03480 [Solirubrobacterales bacterium]|nr:hypothetical protein [Solirubrobacterales bacterium]